MNLTQREASLGYKGWKVVVLCFFLAFFSSGFAYYGQSIYLAELQRLRGWNTVVVSTASTTSFLMGALLVVFVGEAIAKFGPRRFLAGGCICLGIAVIMIGQVQSAWQLYPVYLLIAVGWATMNVVAISTIISLWFKVKRGFALSLALNGASVGGMICAPLLLIAVDHFGFSAALIVSIAIMLLILIPMIVRWGDSPSDMHEAHPNSQAATGARWTRKRVLRSLGFWTVSAPFAISLLAQVGFLVHLIAILQPK